MPLRFAHAQRLREQDKLPFYWYCDSCDIHIRRNLRRALRGWRVCPQCKDAQPVELMIVELWEYYSTDYNKYELRDGTRLSFSKKFDPLDTPMNTASVCI